MTRIERLRKRLHILQTNQEKLTDAEKQWLEHIKQELNV